jgi:dihydrofolate synthase / folylpolyglutamate synthase
VNHYQETLDWLYAQLPVFQHQGASPSYKLDLSKTISFMSLLGNPERAFPVFHVAGTNGKGSTSHMLASCLQEAGYRVGLYTSPHLVDYRERIRLNGQLISEASVTEFVDKWRTELLARKLSFFEMSVGMAFCAFAEAKVDVAVIEVGLGGRLDSTNVVHSIVTGVTSIDLDHQLYLGDTRAAIAREKAGIFKKGIPAVIGIRDQETEPVFLEAANAAQAPVHWVPATPHEALPSDLLGDYQKDNQQMALCMLDAQTSFLVDAAARRRGMAHVIPNTGLQGRWQVVHESPFTVLDTAHNPHGLRAAMAQFVSIGEGAMHIVIGMVGDKDIAAALACLPKEAHYYFCAPSIQRALAAERLRLAGAALGLRGESFSDVHEAWKAAQMNATEQDRIYIGGSTFVVADALR